MNHAILSPARPASSLLDLGSRPLFVKAIAILLGTLALAAASRIAVPMLPVPMTMQTLAVTLVGAIYGWRFGALTVLLWLAQGAAGLPVLTAGQGGLAYMMGPTAGYLAAFPFVAALTGWLTAQGWNAGRPALAFVAMLLGNALCLLGGALWLSALLGVPKALAVGVTPFLLGAVLKSALGAAFLMAATRLKRRA